MTSLLRIETIDSAASMEILNRRWPRARKTDPGLTDYVRSIIESVEKRGDSAMIEYTSRFDKVRFSPNALRVTRQEIRSAYNRVNDQQISAIRFAKNRIERLEEAFLNGICLEYQSEGMRIRSLLRPLGSVGCYVPGGEAAYPSTLLMTAVPAKIAGVPRIAVCSPPRRKGKISPLTLVAADICGIDEIYKVGGAQAIAALAYGTETIRPVQKIVGPGNKYVLAAKAIVSKDVPTDLPAGPSEIVVLADQSADPRLVALDMISQVEHGPDTISILVTNSGRLADAVAKEFEKIVELSADRKTLARNSLKNSLALICEDIEKGILFVNDFAPEHLEVITKDAAIIAKKVTSAGLILIGEYTPVSASDYCLGTNHVLPTGGYSHAFSGLSALSFVKRINVVECSKEGLSKVSNSIALLARSEGLLSHALAVEARFDGK